LEFQKDNKYVFYKTEIQCALDWLYRIRDQKEKGWAWVQFIRPNEQNTAEVIYAFSENDEWLEENQEKIPELAESISIWLLDTQHATITIDYCWVVRALQKVRDSKWFDSYLDSNSIDNAIKVCLQWLIENKNDNGKRAKGIGWGANPGELSNVARTSLAVIDFQAEIDYTKKNNPEDPNIESYQLVVDQAIEWLLSIQNRDGGWGNLDEKMITQEYQIKHNFSFMDLEYQCDSNAASTGYAMLALKKNNKSKYDIQLRKACEYLKKTQLENGGWEIFTEVGIRNDERYTFRHFGTTWALQGILVSGTADYTDEVIIHGFGYLFQLQDKNYGGWKSSPDADNYTWATCNALTTVRYLKTQLSDVHAELFLSIVWDWWELRKKDANYSFKIGKKIFAFNSTMALSFCIVFSIMLTLMLFMIISIIEPGLRETSESVRKLVYSTIIVVGSVVLGLPWIVFVKNRFKSEVDGWIDSIGWVYGIITGFVLVLYQFIL